jgi:hypothetical protein
LICIQEFASSSVDHALSMPVRIVSSASSLLSCKVTQASSAAAFDASSCARFDQ